MGEKLFWLLTKLFPSDERLNPLAVVEVNEETPEMDWEYYETDVTSMTAVEVAFLIKQVDLIAILGQHVELSKDQTLNYVELMMRTKNEVSVEEFRKRVMSLPVDEVNPELEPS